MEEVSEYIILHSDVETIIKLLKSNLVSRKSIYDLINFIIENNKDDIVLFLYELLEMEENTLIDRIIKYLIYNPQLIIESELIYFADYVKIANIIKDERFKEFLISIIPNIIKYHLPSSVELISKKFYPLIFALSCNGEIDIAVLIMYEIESPEGLSLLFLQRIFFFENFNPKLSVEYMKIIPKYLKDGGDDIYGNSLDDYLYQSINNGLSIDHDSYLFKLRQAAREIKDYDLLSIIEDALSGLENDDNIQIEEQIEEQIEDYDDIYGDYI